MDGKKVAELLRAWDNMSQVLTPVELQELIDGLKFLQEFNRESEINPLTVYYSARLEAVENAKEARARAELVVT